MTVRNGGRRFPTFGGYPMAKSILIYTNIPAFSKNESPFAGVRMAAGASTSERCVDLEGLFTFMLTIASGVSTGVVANWLYERLKVKAAQSASRRVSLRIHSTEVNWTDSNAIERALEVELTVRENDDSGGGDSRDGR